MIDSLIIWLELISANSEGSLTHWEIEVVMTEILDNNYHYDDKLKSKLYPLILALKNRGKSHKHKSLIASFTLRLIEEYREKEKKEYNLDPEFF